MPMIVVTARFINDDGQAMWAFAREETMPIPQDPDPQLVHEMAAQTILDDLDAARTSISKQIAASATYLGT